MLTDLLSKKALESMALEKIRRQANAYRALWPDGNLADGDGNPLPFHIPQSMAMDSKMRTVAMLAGTQSGKTSFGPWWLEKEITKRGSGDYLAVTATFDLFKLKMLPMMLQCFEQILKIGRYWTGDRVIELKDPETGNYWATKSTDNMWARIILRSADALGGLESATAMGAWLDEAGQDRFTFDAYKAIRRRLSLKRGRMLISTTLYNVGWLDEQVISKAIENGVYSTEYQNEGEIERYTSEVNDVDLIQFDSIVNPEFPKREYDEMKETMPEDEFAMFYRGRKANRRFLIYDCFDREHDSIPRFSIPDSWTRYFGFDFGGTHLAVMFYAEEPATMKLYCYREYLGGQITIKEHASRILEDEVPGYAFCVGGARGEDSWRLEFSQYGIDIKKPDLEDVDLGINRVYAQHKKHGIIYFKDLYGILDEKGRYRRKRGKDGELLDEIENKGKYHYLDAERYIISEIRPGDFQGATVIALGARNG